MSGKTHFDPICYSAECILDSTDMHWILLVYIFLLGLMWVRIIKLEGLALDNGLQQ